jgi:hypothetical protein
MVELKAENLGENRHGGMRPNFDDQTTNQWSEPTLKRGEISGVTKRITLEHYFED